MYTISLFDWERLRTRFVILPDNKVPPSVKTRIGDFVVIVEVPLDAPAALPG